MNQDNEKVYPDSVRFLLSDDIREEANNKISLMGVYAGDDVIVHDETPGKALSSLALLSIFKGGKGVFQVKMELFSPSNKKLGQDMEMPETRIQSGVNQLFVVKFPGFPVPEFGPYKIKFTFDDKKNYEYTFIIKAK